MNALKYQKLVGGNDWWNPQWRIDLITSCMKQIDFRGKKVLETGSRFGISSYVAHTMGASHVTGIESDQVLVKKSVQGFKKARVHPSEYRFIQGDVHEADMSQYDIILCLGMFYNEILQNELLWNCRKAPITLLESWTDQNSFKYPILTYMSGAQQLEYGFLAGRTVKYTQYSPNVVRLEQQMTDMGFSFTKLNQHIHGHCDMLYLLKPHKQTPFRSRWGINPKRLSVKYQ